MRPRIAAAVATVVAVLALPIGTAFAAPRGDSTIDLPAGFAGEGVAVGRGQTFYAGSLVDGRIARGDLRRGTAVPWVTDPVLAPAVGLDADLRHGLLWVSGGPTGEAAAYDLDTGEVAAELTLTTEAAFINDVVSTHDAAYFTNSMRPELYRVPASRGGGVGEPETLPLTGPAGVFVPGFNLNGIEATPDGKTLIVVNSTTGQLFTVDATSGDSALIDLGAGSVRTGDGLLLAGHTLYVLQNGNAEGAINQIAVVRLSSDLSSGRIVRTITSPLFETATTLAKRGNVLVAVNAQFGGAPIDERAEVVLLRAR
jgi:sugar lactone lactonase YvrE